MRSLYNTLLSILLLSFICFGYQSVNAQSTFEEVVSILQTNCATAYCHGPGSSSGGLSLAGTSGDIYNAIVNVTPNNATAAGAGMKLIDPAYPNRSFLFKKVNNNLEPNFSLVSGENDPMPIGGALSKIERETIRQWIIYGAPQTGTVVDMTLIEDYYNDNGLPALSTIPPPPAGEGFQIHHGPIFVAPGGETEHLRRYKITEADAVDVNKFQVHMNEESHHFIIYDYLTNPSVTSAGIQVVGSVFDLFDINDAATTGVWQFDYTHELPAGTAYRWVDDNVINLNYHIANYNPDSILAAEVFINVYTQPLNTAPIEMIAGLTDDPPLFIPNDGATHTFSAEYYDAGSTETWSLWQIQAHTHKLGTDFDVYLRNADGSRGDQIYEGFFNSDYTFNQGFYDYEHPAIREFDPPLAFPAKDGIIVEASYVNNGSGPVTWGLTTEDEMCLAYFQLFEGEYDISSAIDPVIALDPNAVIYPNPTAGAASLSFTLEQADVVNAFVYDMQGRQLLSQLNQAMPAGTNTLTLATEGLPSGRYLVVIQADEQGVSRLPLLIAR